MIFDSSAWIEFFMSTGSPANLRLRRAVGDDATIVVPEPVLMELLIGTTNETAVAQRRLFLDRFEIVPYLPMVDSQNAAALHRACRRGGETIRNLVDCQIAAMAIRLNLPVLHRDPDFEAIARHTRLQTIPLLT